MKKLLMFVTEKELMAFDVTQNESISIDGKTSLRYESYLEAEKFCHYLKDYFNIDSFDQTDLAVTIVCCNCDLAVVEKLYTDLRGCKSINIIDVEKLLSVVADNRCLQKGGQKYFSILNVAYSVTVGEDGKIGVEQSEKSDNVYELQPQDFDFVYEFVLQRKWDEEKDREYKALLKSEKNIEKKNCELERENKKLKEDFDEAKNEMKSLRRKQTKLENQLEEKSLNEQRTVLKLERDDIRGNRLMETLYSKLENDDGDSVFYLQLQSKNGDFVEVGDKIGKVVLKQSEVQGIAGIGLFSSAIGSIGVATKRHERLGCELKAPSSGQIVVLRKSGKINVGDDYAIICDPADDVDKVKSWYKKLGR